MSNMLNIRKRTAAVIAAVMALMCLMPVTALAAPASDAVSEYVFDGYGSLAADEIKILDTRCSWLYDDSGLELLIVTAQNAASLEDISDKYAEEHFSDGDGAVFCADIAADDITFKTYGMASEWITEEECGEIIAVASKHLANAGLYRACQSIVYNCDNICTYYGSPSYDKFFTNSVADETDYLTDDEYEKLKERLNSIREAYNVDVAVAIDEEMWGDTAEQAADDTYDYYFYGAGAGDDGILLYISKEPRNYYITTHGYGATAVTDAGVDYLKETITPHLQNDEYYDAIAAYADGVDWLLDTAAKGEPYDIKGSKSIGKAVLIGIIISLVLSLVIAKILNKGKVEEMNTAREQTDAHGYMRPGSFNLQMSQDVFLYSRIDKEARRQESSSGGGGSSMHTSSSGRSHSGGGGSY